MTSESDTLSWLGKPELRGSIVLMTIFFIFFIITLISSTQIPLDNPSRITVVIILIAFLLLIAYVATKGFQHYKPRSLVLDTAGIHVKGYFPEIRISWNQVARIETARIRDINLYPRGFFFFNRDGTFIGHLYPQLELGRVKGEEVNQAILKLAKEKGIPVEEIKWRKTLSRKRYKGMQKS